jgi:hypothetical protein
MGTKTQLGQHPIQCKRETDLWTLKVGTVVSQPKGLLSSLNNFHN